MKPTNTGNENSILLPGEDVWELWRQTAAGWVLAERLGATATPAECRYSRVFGYPVAAAFAVPIRAATTDEEMLPDIIDVQVEKQGLKPEAAAGCLMDYRTVEQVDGQTLLLASVLHPGRADTLPKSAPQQFEVSPYLYYLPDNALVIWKELGRLVFCVTRGDQPLYFHALNTPDLGPETAQEIEQMLMPLYMQGMAPELETIRLWTEAVQPGAAEVLQQVFGVRVMSEARPAPAPPVPPSGFEPVSVALGKQRATKLRRIRNIAAACAAAYLIIPGFFAVKWFMTQRNISQLQKTANNLEAQYGWVETTVKQEQAMDSAVNFDKYPIEMLKQVLDPLYQQQSMNVRVTSIEIERDHKTGEGEVADITIKGEGQTSQNSIRYTNVIKANPALKEYEWVPKVEAPKNGAVPFQIKGTTKKKDDAA
jgi:hypothetical protein